MPTSHSELSLVQRAVQRDRVAFAALYDRYVDRIYKHAYYWVPDQAEAEDITQEVFVRAWRFIERYKITGAPFIAWLTAITRNLIAQHYRAAKRFVPLDEATVNADTDGNPEAIAEANFNRSHVRNAVLKLKGEKQKVVLMRFIDGMSYEEIAAALNKAEGAIRVIQFRALKELRHILEADRK